MADLWSECGGCECVDVEFGGCSSLRLWQYGFSMAKTVVVMILCEAVVAAVKLLQCCASAKGCVDSVAMAGSMDVL